MRRLVTAHADCGRWPNGWNGADSGHPTTAEEVVRRPPVAESPKCKASC
jgi:hypothetical protein